MYGRAYGIPSVKRSVIVLRQGLTDSTLAHETLHAMGLHHSFSNKGSFTFEEEKTDNIMDYSHKAGIDRVSTWQWQWPVIQSNIDKEYIEEELQSYGYIRRKFYKNMYFVLTKKYNKHGGIIKKIFLLIMDTLLDIGIYLTKKAN